MLMSMLKRTRINDSKSDICYIDMNLKKDKLISLFFN